ncbi:inositol-tetrakisphosphate 1-kinase 3-like protein isoform X6 [Tanacetum coccineum]
MGVFLWKLILIKNAIAVDSSFPRFGIHFASKCVCCSSPCIERVDHLSQSDIARIDNRVSFLSQSQCGFILESSSLHHLLASWFNGTVGVPRQLVIEKDPLSISDAVRKAGLSLPLVAKPLVAKSHELSLAYDEYSLQKLEPPLVLQEFVNHGGVLFKVYIVGDAIKVLRRFSLPDVSKRELSRCAGVFRFPRVSSAAQSADDADLDPCIAELPPRALLERLARELRRRLGLHLFNLDMIREHGTRDRFYVIDINYFPGYGKMPEYEHIFTDFLLNLAKSKYKKRSASLP